MGHSSYAYITRIQGTLTQTASGLQGMTDAASYQNGKERGVIDSDGYTIRDNPSIRDITDDLSGFDDFTPEMRWVIATRICDRVQAGIEAQRNADGNYVPYNKRSVPDWDPDAKDFFFRYAGKWEPTAVMALDDEYAFVFGTAGD